MLDVADRAFVEGTLEDVGRRLQYGDGILGWEGDANMGVYFNTDTRQFEVCTLAPDGTVVVVVARPYCDQRLILDVIKADTRRFDPVRRIIEANEANQREATALFREQMAEKHDRLHHALVRDVGHQHYGMSRRAWGYG